ncbi:MAG: IS66 family transposase [bacterium]
MNYLNLSNEQLIKLLEEKNNELNVVKVSLENTTKELIDTKFDLKTVNKLYQLEQIKHRKLNEKFEALLLKYENKNEQYKKEIYDKFVSKSEKTKHEINDAEHNSKKGRKVGCTNFASKLTPTRSIIIEPDEKVCASCNEALIEIGEDKTIKIVKIPSTYEVVEYISKKYVCKDKCENKIYQKLKNDPFGKSAITSTFVADVINMRYNLCVPLDRFSKHLKGLGLDISTQCLSNYVMKSAELLLPLYNLLKKELVNNTGNVIHADETTINVLEVTNKVKCYMFAYVTSYFDRPVYLYEFSVDRTTEKTSVILDGFKGTLVVDGFPGYTKFKKEGIKIQRCMVHARREFYNVIKSLTKEQRNYSKAKKVIDRFDAIFKLERNIKSIAKTLDDITEMRNSSNYKRKISELDDAVNTITAVKGSTLSNAVTYYKNSREDMFTYLNDPCVEPSNNTAERAIKPFVILRKNMLFSKTENGAQATALLLSITQTLKANGIHPEKYLEYAFDNYEKLISNPNDFLPWSNKLPENLRVKFE